MGKRRWRAALQGGLPAACPEREAPWSAARQRRFGPQFPISWKNRCAPVMPFV